MEEILEEWKNSAVLPLHKTGEKGCKIKEKLTYLMRVIN
jgi:hypothetical protein